MRGPCGFCNHFYPDPDPEYHGCGECGVDADFEGCAAGRPCPSFVPVRPDHWLAEQIKDEEEEAFWKELDRESGHR